MKPRFFAMLFAVCALVLLFTMQSESFLFLSRTYLQHKAHQSRSANGAVSNSNEQPSANPNSSLSSSSSLGVSRDGKRRPKIAVAFCATAKGPQMTRVKLEQMALMRFALPSLLKTMEKDRYEYELYVGVDDDDTFWNNAETQRRVHSAAGRALKVVFRAFPSKKNRIPFNEIMIAAFDGGADYFVRINDDTEFVTGGWSSQGVATLLGYDPPNIGVVGPTCGQGNTNILTHDMVHRTHFVIFKNKYYPEVFDNWWVDDWITGVYGKDRTKKLKTWQVNHHTKYHRTRYHVNYKLRNKLSAELEKGRQMLKEYLDRSSCTLKLGVPFAKSSGIDQALFEQVYHKREAVKCRGVIVEVSDRPGYEFANSVFFEEGLAWKSILITPDKNVYGELKEKRPKAKVYEASLGKTSLPWSSSNSLKDLFHKSGVKHIDAMVVDAINAHDVLSVMDLSVKVDYIVVKFGKDSNPAQSQVSKLLHERGYLAAEWNVSTSCQVKDCANHLVFVYPSITVVVLTMNRVHSLSRLLNSLESADYGTDPVALEIKIDYSSESEHTAAVANAFRFSHGPKKVSVSNQNKGLALSWFDAWTPHDETSLGIILEDDVEVAPAWYKWVKGAWGAYLHRKDIGGVTLQRQVLIPVRPPIQREIVNNHEPFLYSLVGSIGFAPHPAWWIKFTNWIRSVNFRTVYVGTPELITSHWWKHSNRKHMWTQHFIHFSKTHDLSTLYINLPEKQTLGAHWREKGKHFGSTLGRDYPLATNQKVEFFPRHLVKYGFNGLPRSKVEGESCMQSFQTNLKRSGDGWGTIPENSLLLQKGIGEVLCNLVNRSVNVLEWGTTAITFFFGQNARRWDTITHDSKSFSELKRQLDVLPNMHCWLAKHSWWGRGDGSYAEFKEYVDKPKGLQTKYDLAVINGRARVDCARSLLLNNLLAPNARILIFNWARKEYKQVLTDFEVVSEAKNARPQFAVLKARPTAIKQT